MNGKGVWVNTALLCVLIGLSAMQCVVGWKNCTRCDDGKDIPKVIYEPYQPKASPRYEWRRQDDGTYWLFDAETCVGKYNWRQKTFYRWYAFANQWSQRAEHLPQGVTPPVGDVGELSK